MEEPLEFLDKQADAVRWLQEKLGFKSLREFADALDVNTSTISRWMHPQTPRAMRPENRWRLAQLVGSRCRSLDELEQIRTALNEMGWNLASDEWREAERHINQKIIPYQMPRTTPADFVNREHEFDDLKQELLKRSANSPIVLLDGIPGVGKTSLVARVWQDEEIQMRFSDGIVWVRMEPQTTTDTSEKNLEEQAFASLVEQVFPDYKGERGGLSRWDIQRALAKKNVLLVLDGVESWVKLSRWLLVDPGFGRLLVTTRRRDLSGDLEAHQVWSLRLAPLNTQSSLKMLTQGLQVDPTDEDLLWIAALLDGLPIALRIVNYLARSDGGFHLLARELKEEIFPSLKIQPHKSANVRACFELSYRRLDEQTAGLFRFLGKFPQPFDVEAVAYVLDQKPERISRDFRSLALAGLVDVVHSESQQYQLHRLLHEYARTLSQEQDEVQHPEWEQRFAEHYLNVTQDAWQSWLDGEERQALQIWRRNLKHIEQGFDCAAAADHADWVLKYLLSTGFYLGYGGFREIVNQWRAQFERLIPNGKDSVLGKLHLGDVYLLLGELDQAARILVDAQKSAKLLDERVWLSATIGLAQALLAAGKFDEALHVLSDETYTQIVEKLLIGDELYTGAWFIGGKVRQIMGQFEDARHCYLKALESCDYASQTGRLWKRMILLLQLGEGLLALEEHSSALQVFEDARILAEASDYEAISRRCAFEAVITLAQMGEVQEAAQRLDAISTQADDFNDGALALAAKAEVLLAMGDWLGAEQAYRMAIEACPGPLTETDIWVRLGDILHQYGEGERAAEAWQRARDCGRKAGYWYKYSVATLEYAKYLQSKNREEEARSLLLELATHGISIETDGMQYNIVVLGAVSEGIND